MNETLDQRGGAAGPPHQPAGPVWWSRRTTWFAVAGGLALSLGVWLVLAKLPRLLTTPEGGAPVPSAPAATGEARKIHATLFYVADTGNELMPVNAEVPFGDSPAEQARRIAEAQVQPPVEGTLSAIPAGTKVRAVYLTSRGEAYLDLSADVARWLARRSARGVRARERAHRQPAGHHGGSDSDRRQGSGYTGRPRRPAASPPARPRVGEAVSVVE